jgi:hypothetical protein
MGKLTSTWPETKTDPDMPELTKTPVNTISLPANKYNELLALFPAAWQEKLRIYTYEELFYCYKLCKFKPSKRVEAEPCSLHNATYCSKCALFKQGDVTYCVLRAKLHRYVKGQLDEYFRPCKPIAPSAWNKLGGKFRNAFADEVATIIAEANKVTEQDIEKLTQAVNAKRVA